MRRGIQLILGVVGLVFGIQSAFATTIAVGTCRPALPHYSTISAAVAVAPAGATVLVCPGTYPEQVVITAPITLQGISAGNANRAVISASSGVSANVTSTEGTLFAAQVLVEAGPVNITNITVDGTGNGLGGSAWLAGIFYASGSSGIVNGVTTRNQIDSGLGVGIWAENGNSTPESVTIQNCNVHDFDGRGIDSFSNQSPSTLTAVIKGNRVTDLVAIFGIAIVSAATVTGNVVVGPGTGSEQGITSVPASSTVSGNIVTNWEFGLVDFGGGTYTSNTVTDTSEAFFAGTPGVNVQKNTFAQAASLAMDFECFTPTTVSGNTISDTPVALDDVPLGFTLMPNTYQNVDAIRSGGFCTSAPEHRSTGPAPKPILPLP